MNAIFHRTSIRKYKEQMVEQEKILSVPGGLHAFAIIPCGYPVAVNAQEDRYEEARVHYV